MSKHARPWRLSLIHADGDPRAISDHARNGLEAMVANAEFDEIVVGRWFHAEMMDDSNCFVQIGNAVLNVHATNRGVSVKLIEGRALEDGRIVGGRE